MQNSSSYIACYVEKIAILVGFQKYIGRPGSLLVSVFIQGFKGTGCNLFTLRENHEIA